MSNLNLNQGGTVHNTVTGGSSLQQPHQINTFSQGGHNGIRGSTINQHPFTGTNLLVDKAMVEREGYLQKKGNVFSGFQRKYFYLEDSFLKYGKRQNNPSSCMDLRDALVTLKKNTRTQFKIKTRKQKLKLKAESEDERLQWVTAISAKTGKVPQLYSPNNRGSGENTAGFKIAGLTPSGAMPGGRLNDQKSGRLSKALKNQKSITLTQISDLLRS